MCFRCFRFALLAALVVAAGFGCSKSQPGPGPASVSASNTIARVHWLGRQRLAADTNAAAVMEVWNLPQSATLETQTLDKLSLAPWRWLKGAAAASGAPTALLRPLLDDLVRAESYLEVRAAPGQPGRLAFAIRLDDARAGLWQTNLAAVLESLTGSRPAARAGDARGWSLKKSGPLNLVELTRAGEWTLVGLAPDENALLAEMLARLKSDPAPFPPPATNFWLETVLDLPRVSTALALNWRLPADFPRVSLSLIGDGRNVNTRGHLDFAKPLALALPAWNIPTNYIHDPLVSFVAVRGVKPWFESLKQSYTNLPLPVVDQVFGWATEGFPLQTYFAAPVVGASNQLNLLADALVRQGNPWIETNGMGRFERLPGGNGVSWARLPMVHNFLRATTDPDGGEFLFGGWLPYRHTNQPPPAEILQMLASQTNLIAYDWEITQPRIEGLLLISQVLRLALFKAQLPASSASMAWLKHAGFKLGNSVTAVTQTSPSQITLVRQSTLGLTSLELHLFADWLESPQFPSGLHTFLAPAEFPMNPKPAAPAKTGNP